MATTDIYLIIAAYLTSTLSGLIGMGGGIILLTFMTTFFPPAVLIPIHGAVQLGSNTSRALLNYKSLNWPIIATFLVGALAGAFVGSKINVDIPDKSYKIILAVFILVATWAPKFKAKKDFKFKFTALGFFVTPWSLFVGATGPLLAPFFMREGLSKHGIVATKAACQIIVHCLKLVIFSMMGFVFAGYLHLIVYMILAVIAGSYTGKLLLNRVPDKMFYIVFKVLITFLALRLLYKAFS